jgi:hypothetical protein
MRRRLALPLTLLALGAAAGAQPTGSAESYQDAAERPAASRAAAFGAAYQEDARALARDAAARRGSVSSAGIQRLEGIRQRARELEEEAARLGAMERGELRRAQRGMRRELKRLRRELDRTQ